MRDWLKSFLPIAAALGIGLLSGYILGRWGKSTLKEELHKAERRATEAAETLKGEQQACLTRAQAAHGKEQLLHAKHELLRALIELSANNYGLTSQHLARARSRLKSAARGFKKAQQERLAKLFEGMADAQTLAMRLDPMAKVSIEQILGELQRFPGGS